MKVTLFMDVDGCLNARSPFGWGARRTAVVTDTAGDRIRITWAPRLVEQLAALDVDLVFVTTWLEDATGVLADAIGWGSHARVLRPPAGLTWPSIGWKADAVAADQMVNPSPFIWVDDELSDRHRNLWPDAMLISPFDHIGLTPAHLEQMREFTHTHTA